MKLKYENPIRFFSRIIWQRISTEKSSLAFGVVMFVIGFSIPYILKILGVVLPYLFYGWGGILIIAGTIALFKRS